LIYKASKKFHRKGEEGEEGKKGNATLDASLSGLFAFAVNFLIYRKESQRDMKEALSLYPLRAFCAFAVKFFLPVMESQRSRKEKSQSCIPSPSLRFYL
jgi:hypothetical protein